MSSEPRGHWYRSYEEMSKDPKFRVVAKRAASVVPGVRVSDAIAVWVNLLERASQAPERGTIEGFDPESCDALFDLPDGAALALLEAFQGKGMVKDGAISKWAERQPQRERPNDLSTGRTRRFKEKAKQNAQERHGNATGTPGNATDQNRTEQNIHEEERACGEGEDRKPPKLDRPSKASRPHDWKGFMLLWSAYPKHQGQEEAWCEYCRLKDNNTLEDPAYIRDKIIDLKTNDSQWLRGIGIPSLEKWLHGKRWGDEPFTESTADGQGGLPDPQAVTAEEWERAKALQQPRDAPVRPKHMGMAGARA